MITLNHFLILSAVLFFIGVHGVLTRRNAIGVLMSLELMFNAVNLNLVAFSRFLNPPALTGQIFAVFIITVAAAEVAVGVALVLSLYRNFQHINVDDVSLMKG